MLEKGNAWSLLRGKRKPAVQGLPSSLAPIDRPDLFPRPELLLGVEKNGDDTFFLQGKPEFATLLPHGYLGVSEDPYLAQLFVAALTAGNISLLNTEMLVGYNTSNLTMEKMTTFRLIMLETRFTEFSPEFSQVTETQSQMWAAAVSLLLHSRTYPNKFETDSEHAHYLTGEKLFLAKNIVSNAREASEPSSLVQFSLMLSVFEEMFRLADEIHDGKRSYASGKCYTSLKDMDLKLVLGELQGVETPFKLPVSSLANFIAMEGSVSSAVETYQNVPVSMLKQLVD